MRISVAGVAEKEGKFLIALRKPGTSIGECWEFPGGKTEQNESPGEAIIREYREELDVGVEVIEKLCEGEFRNGLKHYRLMAYSIRLESENFKKSEHQQVKWADISELKSLDFPDSDQIIIDYLLSR